MDPKKEEDLYQSLLQELRRGTIVLTVLSQLHTPQYGYSLVVLLEKKGIPVEAGTLYPLLRRLEKQTLLESHWHTETSKPRKYYQLSETGKKMYENLRNEWFQMTKNMEEILKE
ncbi:PadR family transcriptional regulator [Fervidibacillus albus]|uniref:PadR family transcriptional regulator n=1 Tax=Fervidibacillus albus TaxID=2980026 RepID=A0A9E8LS48_9BACI|nr:PadR family transcriptional regulator [Fervidibacillus albus]WAA08575.1 PadR family transcriptional regulator [Fervidibacillus albus]